MSELITIKFMPIKVNGLLKTVACSFTYVIHFSKGYTILMVDIKAKTIFSKIPAIIAKVAADDNGHEDKKISDWLEKLHIQGERVRTDNNRREEQAKTDANNLLEQELSTNNEAISLKQIGIDAHKRTSATKNEADTQKVNELVRKSNRRIISISSSFPWSIFPNTINVEESRVTFKFSQFFSSQSHSVEIKDISNVFIESSLFFSTLQVVSRTYIQNDIKIGYLNRKEALLVQRIIEGLRTFAEHDINTSNYEIDELISKIGEFHTQS